MDWTRKDFFVVQERTERRFRGALNFGVTEDGCVLVGGKVTLLGVRVIPFEAEVGNVVVHGDATGALGVTPLLFFGATNGAPSSSA